MNLPRLAVLLSPLLACCCLAVRTEYECSKSFTEPSLSNNGEPTFRNGELLEVKWDNWTRAYLDACLDSVNGTLWLVSADQARAYREDVWDTTDIPSSKSISFPLAVPESLLRSAANRFQLEFRGANPGKILQSPIFIIADDVSYRSPRPSIVIRSPSATTSAPAGTPQTTFENHSPTASIGLGLGLSAGFTLLCFAISWWYIRWLRKRRSIAEAQAQAQAQEENVNDTPNDVPGSLPVDSEMGNVPAKQREEQPASLAPSTLARLVQLAVIDAVRGQRTGGYSLPQACKASARSYTGFDLQFRDYDLAGTSTNLISAKSTDAVGDDTETCYTIAASLSLTTTISPPRHSSNPFGPNVGSNSNTLSPILHNIHIHAYLTSPKLSIYTEYWVREYVNALVMRGIIPSTAIDVLENAQNTFSTDPGSRIEAEDISIDTS
ncbi:uncharacterized protein GIQ15_04847 [Arthroderma uncinatum]|uniref:uncharacterized protein n=1 Tax=Arthroderma uncinatum TaxID=74035 RepID=UPI00144AEE45|nr:uncharacterized protein GIQ15_04847 [Arthroderma uncinatum]KAF3482088.1 hypothetical protein GIQ15_04847 [Arthroderma uncinatum]